jgi:hypothetical protein
MNISPQRTKLNLLIFLTAISTYTANAGGVPPPPPRAPGPPGLPIDNGLLLLACIAIVYGIYIIQKLKFQYK